MVESRKSGTTENYYRKLLCSKQRQNNTCIIFLKAIVTKLQGHFRLYTAYLTRIYINTCITELSYSILALGEVIKLMQLQGMVDTTNYWLSHDTHTSLMMSVSNLS